MPRPSLSEAEKHSHEFRLRLQPDDAMLVRLIAKRLGLKPAVLLRVMILKNLKTNSYLKESIQTYLAH